MFGTYRYILALMVAIAHLAPINMVHVGFYAVFGFFTLSGYLMTLVLHTTYYKLPHSYEKYTANRLLRILPSYWVVLFFSALAAAYFPIISKAIHERLQWPDSIGDWIANIFVLGLTILDGRRSVFNLVPPAWSLSVEIVFWLLMPFLVRSKTRLYVWGFFAIAYTIFVSAFIENSPLNIRYYSHLAAALPFFSGAAIYMLTKRPLNIHPSYGFILILVSIVFYIAAGWIYGTPSYSINDLNNLPMLNSGLYAAMILNCITIYFLSRIDTSALPEKIMKMDKLLGNLSYPIFLLHIFTAIVIVAIADNTCTGIICGRSWQLTAMAFPIVNMLAIGLWLGVEKPVSIIREKIKKKC